MEGAVVDHGHVVSIRQFTLSSLRSPLLVGMRNHRVIMDIVCGSLGHRLRNRVTNVSCLPSSSMSSPIVVGEALSTIWISTFFERSIVTVPFVQSNCASTAALVLNKSPLLPFAVHPAGGFHVTSGVAAPSLRACALHGSTCFGFAFGVSARLGLHARVTSVAITRPTSFMRPWYDATSRADRTRRVGESGRGDWIRTSGP